ncbi:hypothetical protein GGD83_002553 [Rhodoblastus sphagnicola]|uniref:hypothetical protein n=1 Tax=Rhodoblastus sphagnicola TaxID=333368 RepID=UPI0011B07E37|nr:hypothetical protein [Rhodoblastus sphagnicola]MBB4198744.1 hypothetical protein [Rhodoblastus sphagnicola]
MPERGVSEGEEKVISLTWRSIIYDMNDRSDANIHHCFHVGRKVRIVIARRTLLAILTSALARLPAHSKSAAGVKIGAIRWDAWYTQSPKDGIRNFVQRTLSPEQWRDRAPSCTIVNELKEISFDECGVQSRIDSEIVKAHDAGIDYWAYCWFGADHPMQNAWRLHQSSTVNHLVNWCCILSFGQFVQYEDESLHEMTRQLRFHNYQSVLGGRPLLFIMQDKTGFDAVANGIRNLRLFCNNSGLRDPYVVLLVAASRRGILSETGADAIGAYERASPTPVAGDYEELAKIAESYWSALAGTGQAIVPTAMTGWDTRPRQETPVPWTPNPRSSSGEAHYFRSGTPEQIAAHVHNMLEWIRLNYSSCPAQTGLIYSWDEHDEGGSVLNSTLGAGDSILNAIGKVLK